jgi:hypothetical protein
MLKEYYILFAFKSIAKKDSSINRQIMFSHFLSKHAHAALFIFLMRFKILKPILLISIVLKSISGLIKYRILNPDSEFVSVYQFENEKNALQRILDHLPFSGGYIFYSSSVQNIYPVFQWLMSLKMRSTGKTLKLAMFLFKKSNTLVAIRQLQFLIFFSYFNYFFRKKDFTGKYFASSTESNPEILAPLLAAKKCNATTIYTNHGQLASDLGYFNFDKYILSSQSIYDRVKLTMTKNGSSVLINGIHGHSPIVIPKKDDIKRIIIIGSIVWNIKKIESFLKKIRDYFPSAYIHLRLHPNQELLPKDFASYIPREITYSMGQIPLIHEIKNYNLAFAGASSSHIEILESGIPTVYFELDNMPYDYYDFVKRGLVYDFDDFANLEDGLRKTYSNELWKNVMEYYSKKLNHDDSKILANFLKATNDAKTDATLFSDRI